jgi:hypothetical protein
MPLTVEMLILAVPPFMLIMFICPLLAACVFEWVVLPLASLLGRLIDRVAVRHAGWLVERHVSRSIKRDLAALPRGRK